MFQATIPYDITSKLINDTNGYKTYARFMLKVISQIE